MLSTEFLLSWVNNSNQCWQLTHDLQDKVNQNLESAGIESFDADEEEVIGDRRSVAQIFADLDTDGGGTLQTDEGAQKAC